MKKTLAVVLPVTPASGSVLPGIAGMARRITWFAALAVVVTIGTAAQAAPMETISFSGTLQNGYNNSNGPFGPGNQDLTGDTYSVSLSYNPSLFTQAYSDDSCGSSPGTSCYFTFSAANPVSEVLTVNGISQSFTATSGGFTLGGGSSQNVSFSFQGSNGLSLSGYFQDGTSFFPNSNNVNNPIFSNFTNVALSSAGTFNESNSNPGFSLGANPASVSAVYTTGTAVPEPASVAVLGAGLLGIGLIGRRHRA